MDSSEQCNRTSNINSRLVADSMWSQATTRVLPNHHSTTTSSSITKYHSNSSSTNSSWGRRSESAQLVLLSHSANHSNYSSSHLPSSLNHPQGTLQCPPSWRSTASATISTLPRQSRKQMSLFRLCAPSPQPHSGPLISR